MTKYGTIPARLCSARELLSEAGFADIVIDHVEGDMMNAYYVCRNG